METNSRVRIQARDAAMRLLNRLTVGVAFSAVAGVGLLGAVSAHTIPGKTSTTASTATASSSAASSATSSTASNSSATPASSSSLGSPSTPVTSTSGAGVAVSGGS